MLRSISTAFLAPVFISALLSSAARVEAASLVWKLPEDGTSCTYRGTYSQLVRRIDASEQNVDLSWVRVLTIRSVGTEQGEFRGETVSCRWIEFEQVTGEVVGGEVEPGPGGRLVVKALVPEKLVLPGVTDEIGIPVSFLPVVRGWKQIDENEPVALTSDALDLSPTVTLLSFPRTLTNSGDGGQAGTGAISLGTTKWAGTDVVESEARRTTNETEVWRSDEAPFGVAKWSVRIKVETKDSTSDRSEFQPGGEVSEVMTIAEISDGAVSAIEP